MDHPRVTVGIPVYNEEQFLRRALTSLAAQQYPNLEIIVSDNASQDQTRAICAEFAAADPRFQYHRFDSNQGALRNFQQVLALATGEYFMFGTGDDYWSPQYIIALADQLDRYPNAAMAAGWSFYVDQEGYPSVARAADAPPPAEPPPIVTGARLFLDEAVYTWFYGLFRRSILDLVIPVFWQQRALGGDGIFLLHLLLRYPVTGSKEATIYKRLGRFSSFATRSKLQRVEWQIWYARTLLHTVSEAPLAPHEKRRAFAAVLSHLRDNFFDAGVINFMTLWVRAAVEKLRGPQ